MLEKIQEFDFWILDNIYQKTANYIQKVFGVNCFLLAKICLVVTFVHDDLIPFMIKSESFTKLETLPRVLFFGVVFGLVYWRMCRTAEVYKQGFGNEERYESQFSRCILLFLLLLNCVTLFNPTGIIFLVSSVYFFSCTPLPPQKSIVKKFLESLSLDSVNEPLIA